MTYQVITKRSAEKDTDALPAKVYERIVKRLLALEENPRPTGSKKLQGQDSYRLRVGDYRVLYTVDDKISRCLSWQLDIVAKCIAKQNGKSKKRGVRGQFYWAGNFAAAPWRIKIGLQDNLLQPSRNPRPVQGCRLLLLN